MLARPLERLNLAAIGALCGVALLAAGLGRLPRWPGVLERYGLMILFLGIVSALARQESRLPKALRLAVNFYPMAVIPMIYESLGVLIPALRDGTKDAWLAQADRALFRTDPTVWLERLVWPPLTDLLYVAYATYYFFPILVGALLWRRDPALARRFIFGLSLAFYLSYVGYFLVPAKGPRVELASRQTVSLETTAISRSISKTLDELEHTKDDAFPSGHTMITVYCLLVAYRHERRLFRIWLPVAVLLLLATVYCRFHYVVDVFAGGLLAFAALPVGNRVYGWLLDPAALLPEAASGHAR
jgi:membrane-associated phospholipid phosphatase